jgi:hypothetical protein
MRPGVIDRAVSSFPASLEGEVCQVLRVLPSDGGASEHVFTVQLGDERISIPFRIYFNEPGPSVEANLTSQQRTILNCIYLMHHDGFVRQRRLENLLQLHEEFVIPFKVKLLGEYVIEILEVLDKDINETTLPAYVEFIKANPRFWQQTQSRVISYWNEYYRRKFPKLEEYVGFIIVERIKAANNKN